MKTMVQPIAYSALQTSLTVYCAIIKDVKSQTCMYFDSVCEDILPIFSAI